MKICIVGMEIVPMKNNTFVGSVPNNVVRLSKELSNRGHEISIVTTDVKSLLKNVSYFPWGKIHPIHLRGTYASLASGVQFFLKAIPMILKLHADEKFDVIHGHSAYPILAPIDGLSSMLGDVPAVFTQYSPIKKVPLRDRKGIYQGLSSTALSRLFFANIGCLTVLSENAKESLLKIGIKENRIENLPPVVDTAFFDGPGTNNNVRGGLGIPENAPVVLYIGNWATWKGVDYLIESMTEVKNAFPEARLVTAWGEPYNWYDERKAFLDRKIKNLGLSETVVQVGIVEDLPSLIHISDVVVEPFLNTDGVADLPLAILESMACGKPIVSTRVEGIPEIVHDRVNGLLVHPGDSRELAKAIIWIFSNKGRAKRMGCSARDLALRNHSPTVVVDKLEAVYDSISDT